MAIFAVVERKLLASLSPALRLVLSVPTADCIRQIFCEETCAFTTVCAIASFTVPLYKITSSENLKDSKTTILLTWIAYWSRRLAPTWGFEARNSFLYMLWYMEQLMLGFPIARNGQGLNRACTETQKLTVTSSVFSKTVLFLWLVNVQFQIFLSNAVPFWSGIHLFHGLRSLLDIENCRKRRDCCLIHFFQQCFCPALVGQGYCVELKESILLVCSGVLQTLRQSLGALF